MFSQASGWQEGPECKARGVLRRKRSIPTLRSKRTRNAADGLYRQPGYQIL